MIIVIQGKPGMGKSVYAVSLIEYYLSKKIHTYSNIEVKFDSKDKRQEFYTYIPSENVMQVIPDLREGKVILDEIQTFFNSRKWDDLPIETQVFLQQHRKRGLDIIGVLQSIKRSDKVFRELVQEFYEIKKLFVVPVFGKVMGLFILRQYDEDTIESSTGKYEKVGLPKFLLFDHITFRFYDTTQEQKIKRLCKYCKERYRKKVICETCGTAY